MELALIENLQREDLSPFEEADGLKALADTHGYTHEKMAERLGRSRSSITEALSLTQMPADVRELCRLADIDSKSLLLQVVRQSDASKMMSFVHALQQEGTTRQDARRIAKQGKGKGRGRPRNYVFRYQPREKGFSLALQFRKAQVGRGEIVRALQSIIEDLMREDG
jgi:ParB family transcriptional regulator, chromosome partitioning protein